MTALVIRGDARALPLPDASVDLIVTSPPYYALRSYTDGGVHYDGQIGSEPTPAEYIDTLIDCTAEWVRVLKPGGSMFVDLGDKYAGGGGQWEKDERPDALRTARGGVSNRGASYGFPAKSLMLLPERYRIACVDRLGLIARAVIVWSKPNGLPESVTDRVRRSHEDWVHLTKAPRYYSAVDEIREVYSDNKPWGAAQRGPSQQQTGLSKNKERVDNPLGKLPGSVWSIEEDLWDHVLSGPMRFCPRCGRDLAAGSSQAATIPRDTPDNTSRESAVAGPRGSSTRSSSDPSRTGSPSTTSAGTWDASTLTTSNPSPSGRTSDDVTWPTVGATARMDTSSRPTTPTTGDAAYQGSSEVRITGYVCACTPYTDHPGTGGTQRRGYSPGLRDNNAQGTYGRHQAGEYERCGPWREHHLEGWTPPPTRPAVVLDPFGGTGTTALVASVLGRVGISVDRSLDYSRLAVWRTTNPGERARAMRVPKPEPVAEAQLTLWEATA